MNAAVETVELTKRFADVTALDHCNLRVDAGEVFGLLGPNGAGKSTLLRLLLGFLYPTSGTATIFGLDIVRQSLEVKRRLSYLPGDARLPRHMKARSVLEFFAGIHPDGDLERSLQIADRLQLDLSRRVAFMSTGMRQKAALAAVLGNRTPLLILDEPTANLDPTIRGEVLKIVAEARRHEGRTVIFSSHVLGEIEEVCDACGLLRTGQLAKTLRMSDLKQRHRITAELPESALRIPPALRSHVELLAQEAALVTLETTGDLAPLLGWLATLQPQRMRIEPVGLRSVYDAVHHAHPLSMMSPSDEEAA